MTAQAAVDARWISWMPRWVRSADLARFEVASRSSAGEARRCARPVAEGWRALGQGLRRAQLSLRDMPIADIIAAIDAVAERWMDRSFEPRRRARAEVVIATGFSPEAVDRSFDVELRNYRADSLVRALRRELNRPDVLDRFQPDADLHGSTLATGPRVTLAILTGNVPGLPALSIVRSLLVKSAVIAKVASGEPTFAARFVQTLAEVEPRFGDAIAVTYWERDDEASLRSALAEADAVIAYGSDDACAAIRAHVAPHQRYVEHGHKVSVAVIARDYLLDLGPGEVARRVAVDVSTFNQHACIAPQAVLVEGDAISVRAFAAELATAMDDDARACPLGALEEAEAASLQLRRLAYTWRAASRPGCDLWCPAGLDWAVVLSTDLTGLTGSGNRVVHVVPVLDMDSVMDALRPVARHLQNVGLGANGPQFWAAAETLARLGACRVSEPGRMAEPSMMWRHDGMQCIAQLIRWCDVEMHRESERAGGRRGGA
ncbi:acyl-CoA reductase [Sorangium sp. So ce887]|uniref:acyl-CoA reductase n=1 Tax=Sorangium sp. So ce887 TaxID=3133324 RepID=UPI003F5DD012